MLKGKTKIELFDADTGTKAYESSDENMITNAVERLVNPHSSLVTMNNPAIRRMLSYTTPIATKMLGGILLFDDIIEENPNNVIPPADVNNIGYAGSAYGGGNPYRGSYNENESGKITGGYRHVWDFSTDKANGIIKCVSLTSKKGGDGGWIKPLVGENTTTPSNNENPTFFGTHYEFGSDYCNFFDSNEELLHAAEYKDSGTNIAGIFEGDLTVYYSASSYGPYMKSVRKSNSLNLTKKVVNSAIVADLDVVAEASLSGNTPSFVGVTQEKKIALFSSNGIDAFKFLLFDPFTLEKLSEKTIQSAPITNVDSTSHFYYKGFIYCTGMRDGKKSLGRYTTDGVFVKSFEIDSRINSARVFMDRLILKNISSDIAFMTTDFENFIPFHQYSSNTTLNFTPYNYQQNAILPRFVNAATGYAGIIRPYLATINNLAMPINKTSAQTMKITYEIYDE